MQRSAISDQTRCNMIDAKTKTASRRSIFFVPFGRRSGCERHKG